MKKFFLSLLTLLGITSAAHSEPKTEVLDIESIRYTMPTVALDSIEYVMPTKESYQDAPQFHEDEWGQLEFFSKSRLIEIQKVLKEFNAFEQENRTQYGWNKVFARHITREPILPIDNNFEDLTSKVSARQLPAPILGTSSSPLGQVKDGYSLKLGENAYLYGLKNDNGITVLAAHLAGADDMLLTHAFTNLNKNYGLILVDWRQQFVLISVAKTGELEVWRP